MLTASQPMNDRGFHPIPNPAASSDPLTDPTVQEWERTYATFVHLSGLLMAVFVPVLPAVVLWLVKKNESPYINDHGKEAINFQISLLIYYVAGAILTMAVIGVLIIPAVWVLGIVGVILSSIAANKGKYYRYPMTIRLLS